MNFQTLFRGFICLLLISACTPKNTHSFDDFTIAFGSCNKQDLPNDLWQPILDNHPDLWIWGGDNIYSDTEDIDVMKANYRVQLEQKEYQKFKEQVPIIGTWDDHDYGMNDGGASFKMKDEFQQLFLDFLEVPQNNPRRTRKGVYHSQFYKTPKGSIHVIVLDTRYFRTSLTKSDSKDKRYQPNAYGEGTLLGSSQWTWLEEQLKVPANFTVLVSSIQFLSQEHGFETWGNFPHERDKLISLLEKHQVSNAFILSGDRHISEFSVLNTPQLDYPLIDFTSSGLTHTYTGENTEQNTYRLQNLIMEKSFGVLKFSFSKNSVLFQMRGLQNKPIQEYIQKYP